MTSYRIYVMDEHLQSNKEDSSTGERDGEVIIPTGNQ